MSAAHAHAPSDHPTAPSAAPSAAPAAANSTMHFKHGGVLGLTESIARLVKGVTYDAAMDTFAHPTDGAHPAPHADHHPAPHPTPTADGAHPAPHPAHPTDGAHPAPHHAPAAGHDGHDDDDDDSISGSIIKGLSHMGHYGMAFPVLAQGLKWAKNKMFPEIHEIPTEDQHVGDQILHKLKRNKKKKTELDHHALEGFCKGLDIANLNRTFRMFTDPTRFALAVDREAGREEIKKEIANLLDLSGDVDRKEVEEQTKLLLQLLGDHVDSRVADQHHALVHIIEHVEKWLTKDTLKDIYEPKTKEGNFKIDFEHFGDMLLEEVTPENRDRYLRSIKPSTFPATFKAKFPYLTNEGALKIALKKEPEREKVLTQLRQFTGVDYAMDDKALKEHIDALQGRVGTAPVDDTKPLYHEYKAFEDALTLVKTTMTAPVLADLFEGKTEDASAKFEWTDDKYKNFGTTVLTTVSPKNQAEALKGFDKNEFDETFDLLYPTFDPTLLDDPTKKKRIREQVTALFNVTVPFTQKNLERKKVAILGRLGVTLGKLPTPAGPAVPATATTPATLAIPADPGIEFHPLEIRLVAIVDALKNPELTKLFEDGAWTDANNFAAIFTEAVDYDIPGYIKNYNSGEFRAHFHYLFEMDVPGGLDAVISGGTSEQKEEAKEQIRAFAKQDNGSVSQARILSRISAYKAQMNKADALLKKTAGYKDLKKDIEKIVTNLTDARLNKLFKPVKGPEVRVINYVEFGKTLDSLENANQANAFLRGYKSFAFQKAFRFLTDSASCDEAIATEPGRQAALEQLQTLLALGPGPVTGSVVKAIISNHLSHFDAAKVDGADLKAKLTALEEDLGKIETTLVGDDSAAKRLKVLLNGPEKKTIYDNFSGAVLANKEQTLKEFDGLAFDYNYPYLIQDTFTATASPEEKGKAQAEVEKFFGQKVGKGEAKAKVQSLKKAFEGIKQEVNSAKGFAARQIFERLEQIEQGIEAKIENIYA